MITSHNVIETMEVTGNTVLVIDSNIKSSYNTVQLLKNSQLFNKIITVTTLEEALYIVQKDLEEREININLIFLSLDITTPDQFASAMHLKLLSKEYNKDLVIAGIDAEDPIISKPDYAHHVFKAPLQQGNIEFLQSMLKY